MNFIDKIDNIYKKNNNIEIYTDMDGTIVEFLLDIDKSFMKRNGYLKKQPIIPIIKKLEEIKEKYPLIKIKILSCSSTNQMKREKNDWLDLYMPYVNQEDRIIFSEENGDYNKDTISTIKAEYIAENISNKKFIILIDDDVRVLMGVQNLLKQNVIPIHVTSLFC